MISQLRHVGRFSVASLALALGIWVVSGSPAMAHGGGGGGGGHGGGGFGGGHMGGMGMGGMGMGGMGMGGFGHMGGMGGFGRVGGFGNRGFLGGFGGFGFFPGFYGLGYGYGYPFYGGFGYPYYGLGYGMGYGGYGYGYPYYGGYGGYGYGYPYYGGYGYGYGYPNYGYGNGYGYGYPYYSNVYSAPGAGVTYTSAYVAPSGSAANSVLPAQGRYLGIDEEPVADPNGKRGMKVTNVYPGTPAQRAGLKVGDVLYSINGYLTEQRGNLAWIIANASPTNQLQMTVKTASDGQTHPITAQLQ
jgi:PDZ domain